MLLVSRFKRIAGSVFGEFYLHLMGSKTGRPILLPGLLIFGKIW
jgi:hypothetical protein